MCSDAWLFKVRFYTSIWVFLLPQDSTTCGSLTQWCITGLLKSAQCLPALLPPKLLGMRQIHTNFMPPAPHRYKKYFRSTKLKQKQSLDFGEAAHRDEDYPHVSVLLKAWRDWRLWFNKLHQCNYWFAHNDLSHGLWGRLFSSRCSAVAPWVVQGDAVCSKSETKLHWVTEQLRAHNCSLSGVWIACQNMMVKKQQKPNREGTEELRKENKKACWLYSFNLIKVNNILETSV